MVYAEVNGVKIIGHGGGTKKATQFQIVPAYNMAFAILTNGDHGGTLINSVTATILEAFLDITPTEESPIVLSTAELEPYAGRYEAAEMMWWFWREWEN